MTLLYIYLIGVVSMGTFFAACVTLSGGFQSIADYYTETNPDEPPASVTEVEWIVAGAVLFWFIYLAYGVINAIKRIAAR